MLAENPYGVGHAGTDARACRAATGCRQPYVRGDWFVAAASRPPLCYAVLRLPGSEGELEKSLRVDTRAGVRQEKVARAGFDGSGVSRNNRLIEGHEAGGEWRLLMVAQKRHQPAPPGHEIGRSCPSV